MNAAIDCPNIWLSGSRFRNRIGLNGPMYRRYFPMPSLDRLQIRQNIPVRDRDAFRIARRAGRKQNLRQIARLRGRKFVDLARMLQNAAHRPHRATHVPRRLHAFAHQQRARLHNSRNAPHHLAPTSGSPPAPQSPLPAGIPKAPQPTPAGSHPRTQVLSPLEIPPRAGSPQTPSPRSTPPHN